MIRMPFSHAIHKLPDSTEELKGKDILSPATYFMPGICPVEMMIQNALCEQAPTVILYNHFHMADYLCKFWKMTVVKMRMR